MNIDDIVFDSELKLLKKGEVYLFSDSYKLTRRIK